MDKYKYILDEIGARTKYLYFTRGLEFQEESVDKLDELLKSILKEKEKYVEEKNESMANGLLSIEHMILSQKRLFEMIINLKKDNSDDAWTSLVLAETHIHLAHMAAKGLFSVNDGNIPQFIEGYEKLIFPPQVYNSIEAIYGSSTCSICGEEYGKCNHIKGRAYMGKFCFEQIKDIKEMPAMAIVFEPASKLHRITHSSDDNHNMRDVMTHRISHKESNKLKTKLNKSK